MQTLHHFRANSPARLARHSSLLLAVGLALLMAAMCDPDWPVVTGFAFVALGATGSTTARLQRDRTALSILAVHFCAYASLYLLFVGATLHASAAGGVGGLRLWRSLDLAASLGPMALAAWWTLAALLRQIRGEDATDS